MALYSKTQLAELRRLRTTLEEKGFHLLTLRKRKHPEEFLVIKLCYETSEEGNAYRVDHTALCRLYYGKIRVQFLDTGDRWLVPVRDDLQKWFGDTLCYSSKAFNPTYKENNREWHELVNKGDIAKLI